MSYFNAQRLHSLSVFGVIAAHGLPEDKQLLCTDLLQAQNMEDRF
jgi:hypothetical protein